MNATKAKVMVVDDDDTVRRVLIRMLERKGYGVVPCASGNEALVRMTEDVPDVVLLDLCMPGMDGYQTLAGLREISPRTPVMMLSGYTPDNEREITELGAAGYLCKPVDPMSLFEVIDRYVRPPEVQPCLA